MGSSLRLVISSMEEDKSDINIVGVEDELVRELLDNESPLFMEVPNPDHLSSSTTTMTTNSTLNWLVSALYSGPTIEDIETALSSSVTTYTEDHTSSQPRISMLERSLSKEQEHKYTLRIKSCGAAMADDGYKWRKYGQKSIKNSPHPRSYYRCTNPRCGAKKQVERSIDDPDTLVITYEGLHLHFAYPFFLNQEPHISPTKKQKSFKSQGQAQEEAQQQITSEESSEENHAGSVWPNSNSPPQAIMGHTEEGYLYGNEEMESQGLLEDMVPLVIRNPLMNSITTTTYSNSSSSSSYPSPPTSPSSFSGSPNYCTSLFNLS